MKVENLIDNWIDWLLKEKRLSLNTTNAYRRDMSSFSKFLISYFNKNLTLEILKKVEVKTIRSWFFKRIQKKTTARSNARALSSIKSFYAFLVKKKIIDISKISSINSPKFTQSIPRPLSFEQMKKIFLFLKKGNKSWIVKRNIAIIFLMWGLGMRINEVINMKKTDLSENNWIVIRGKGCKERIMPIYDEIKNFLFDMINDVPFRIEQNDYIFLGEKGKKIHPTIIQKEIRVVRQELNLPENTTPHSFRHTFASQLLDNDVDLRSIQELLGHDSLASTQKYTKVESQRLKRIIEAYHPRSSDDL